MFLRKVLYCVTVYGSACIWLGMESKVADDFRFISTGEVLQYFNFHTGEPQTAITGLYIYTDTGKWLSYWSGNALSIMCI